MIPSGLRDCGTDLGKISLLAGSNQCGFADGVGSAAQFNGAQVVVWTANGLRAFICDSNNHSIRSIELRTGVVTTVVGTGKAETVDGPVATAEINHPRFLAFDTVTDVPESRLYISTKDRIRRLDLSIELSDILRYAIEPSPVFHSLIRECWVIVAEYVLEAAMLHTVRALVPITLDPSGIGVTNAGYVVLFSSRAVYFVNPLRQNESGLVAGSGKQNHFSYRDGPVESSLWGSGGGLAVCSTDCAAYVCDKSNGCIRRIDLPHRLFTERPFYPSD